MKLFSSLICLALAATAAASQLDGAWRGDLSVGPATLPLVFHFSEKEGGETLCTLDSPAQNAYGLPAEVEYAAADSVAVSMKSLGASYAARISGGKMAGTFSQMGRRFPLELTPDIPLEKRRPQTPRPPFPYQEIDTLFRSSDGTILRGTLVLSQDFEEGSTPVCVFVTGSGPQNRDEELFEHRPFAVIADHLGRNGVASFRYDDRGTAQSGGDFASATLGTFKEDARAALLFARGVSGSPVGIIGHSEGGAIALLLAEEGAPDFIVSIAGPVSGKETLLAQNRRQLQASGLQGKSLEDAMTLINSVFDEMARQAAAGSPQNIDVDAIAASLGVSMPPLLMSGLKKNLSGLNAYFISLLQMDARSALPDIVCPVLALNGSLDTQVDAAVNLGAIRDGVRNARVVELPGHNHLLQHAVTGEVGEYGQIRETVSPEALSAILAFLKGL